MRGVQSVWQAFLQHGAHNGTRCSGHGRCAGTGRVRKNTHSKWPRRELWDQMGSAIARIIGTNVQKVPKFAPTVNMWVYEETVNGKKLTDIINTDHENVKYLPGYKLPHNVVAIPSLKDAAKDADVLVFVVPHQFIRKLCDEMVGTVSRRALGITLIKGIDEGPEGLKLISDIIREKMGIDVSVLMGANIANEVAAEKFCETTIGSRNKENGLLFKELLQTPNFRIAVVDDADTVELCGALKNIVAVGAGFCDGLNCGDNTKAAVIRLGLMEMIAFAKLFSKDGSVSSATFLESCGVADLITTCYGGRNRKVAEAFVKTGKTIEELEKEMLNGQKLQGPQTSAEVYRILKQKDMVDKIQTERSRVSLCVLVLFVWRWFTLRPPKPTIKHELSWKAAEWNTLSLFVPSLLSSQPFDSLCPTEGRFPLFTAVHRICYEEKPVQEVISCLQSHPEHM
ncbi:GPD1L protein, partial [Polypterus senegalus]|nr:GPD1L protein [Polypterus senegalus]